MKEWNSKMLEISAFCEEVNAWITTAPEEEYKRIKHSSTLTDYYVKGKYPKATAIFEQCRAVQKLLLVTSDNYRTLLSSFRQERILVGHMAT